MPLVTLVITLIVVGVLLWLVNTYIPMDAKIKKIINVVVVIVVIIWLLRVLVFGKYRKHQCKSNETVPEPATLLFFALGGLAWRRKRDSRRWVPGQRFPCYKTKPLLTNCRGRKAISSPIAKPSEQQQSPANEMPGQGGQAGRKR